MTEFTPEQIKALVGGGNAKHNALYMAGYDPQRDNLTEPTSHDAAKLRGKPASQAAIEEGGREGGSVECLLRATSAKPVH